MKMNSQRNSNHRILFNLSNYKDLFNWINSLGVPLIKNVNKINDLKDGEIFTKLLKYYFQLNKQKYYFTILNSILMSENIIEKMKIVLRIMSQLTDNDKINSRIELFRKNIYYFLSKDVYILELLFYVQYLYQKNSFNENKLDENYNNIKSNMISCKKNTYNSCDRNLNNKRLINNFYDYNVYKRVIVNDAINNNDEYKTPESSIRKEFKNFNSSNNNSFLQNKYLKSKVNSIKSKKRTEISTNYFYLLNNYKKDTNTLNHNINSNNQNLNSNQINDSKINLTDTLNNQDEKTKNLKNKNGKQRNRNKAKKNISNTERGEKEEKIKDLNFLDKYNQIDGYLSKKINKKRNYNYKPNIYKPISNIDKKDEHKNIEKINLKSNEISENNEEPNINYLIGIFHKDKMNFFDGKKEQNKYKIMKLTNPVIFEENNLNKIKPKFCNFKEELNKKKYINKNINNHTIDYIDDSNNIFNNYMNKNEIIKPLKRNDDLEYNSHKNNNNDNNLDNQKNNNKYNEIKSLINNIEPIKRKYLSRQNSVLWDMNKKMPEDLNNVIEDTNNKKEIIPHSSSLCNLHKSSNKYNYDIKISDVKNNDKNFDKNNQIKNIKQIDKNNIMLWLMYLKLIKKEEANSILIPQYISDGILLCDIINKCENENRIPDVYRKMSSKEEALINIKKALDFLKNLEKFPKRHVYDNELIFEIDEQTIWELLDDILNYYSDLNGYPKEFKENVNSTNNLNNFDDLINNNKNSLSRNIQRKLNQKNKYIFNINDSYNFKKNRRINNNNLKYNRSAMDDIDYKFKNDYFLEKNISHPHSYHRNLSNDFHNNDMNKDYFYYVNELKNYFDKNKQDKLKSNEFIQKEESILKNKQDDQRLMNINSSLYFNYNDDANNIDIIDKAKYYKNINNKKSKIAYNYTDFEKMKIIN